MDTLTNLKTFMAVVRTGSFAAAARELHVAASVVTKRITQVEWDLRSELFERTTRKVSLTTSGRRMLPAIQKAVADVEDIFASARESRDQIQGHLRVKVPGALGTLHIGPLLNEFQARNPGLTLEVVSLNRQVNPVEEAFDMAITVGAGAWGGVVDEPLCTMERVLCASPRYLEQRKKPVHPRDLAEHDLVNYLPTGDLWEFKSNQGTVPVNVRPVYSTNDAQLLLGAVISGSGIGAMSDYLAARPIKDGLLVPLLEDFPLPTAWVRALIPENRMQIQRVQALLAYLRVEFTPVPPWQRAPG
jgi:DNA-binding transcriptional LysR family regulator